MTTTTTPCRHGHTIPADRCPTCVAETAKAEMNLRLTHLHELEQLADQILSDSTMHLVGFLCDAKTSPIEALRTYLRWMHT